MAIRRLGLFIAVLSAVSGGVSAPVLADVTYDYSGGGYSEIAPFMLTTPHFVQLGETFTPQTSDLSCGDCLSISFATRSSDYPDDIIVQYPGDRFAYDYFGDGSFGSDGASRSVLGATLLTTGLPNTTGSLKAVSAAPEPAAWLLMMLGVGIAGAALRWRHRATALHA